MLFLLRSLLHVLHFFYYLLTLIASWKSRPQPHELSYPRKQLPRHLALLLASDGDESTSGDVTLECFLESIQRTVGWCREVGIRKLTVYDREGFLSTNIEQVSQRLSVPAQLPQEDEISEIEYPLTPPPSDVSDSRPLSPVNLSSLDLDVSILEIPAAPPSKQESIGGVKHRRKTLLSSEKHNTDEITIHVVSRSSGKPVVARAAHVMANDQKRQQRRVAIQDLNAILEGDRGLPSPDFMIVYNTSPSSHRRKRPLELYGFPPWQITLTEFHYCNEYSPLSWPWAGLSSRKPEPLNEINFRRGLDEFSEAQMRFGK
ncbi:hypothetical protein BJ322DRAFT_705903 [Thelephora terrestris]|uniref:ditrans,polycis-polyprenyl diphosphate synthase [(2E,6E)-farnesyldiphosphate specific] n=1 Tax=Thelephora terrestris TaxID=56493 RepID=A0A9P6HHQ7_9AGAM|nr:hypothetical protein BJ322DRAFT_705903 [Thelephora terrestris]